MVAGIYYKYCTCSNGTSSTYNKGCPVHDPDVRNARCSDCIELESALSAAKERIAELESENARLRAEMERLLAALNWYSEKAEYLAKNDWKKKPEVAEAIFVEMSLDAGRRAQAAIKQAEEG